MVRNKKTNNKNAFTLLEVLLALAIVAVVAILTIPAAINKHNNKILATALKNNVAIIQDLVNDDLIENQTRSIKETMFATDTEFFTSSHMQTIKTCTSGTANSNCWKTEIANYKDIDGNSRTPSEMYTVILPNKAILSYSPPTDSSDATVQIDLNGVAKPNIYGRDFFAYHIADNGDIYGTSSTSYSTNVSDCKSGDAFACFSAVKIANWKIDY